MAGTYTTYAAGRAANIADNRTGLNSKEWYDRNLLENAREKFIVSNFTAKKSQPKYNGNGVIFSYYENIPSFTTPLAEGSSGNGGGLSKVNVRTNLDVYGLWIPYTEELDIFGEDGARFKKDVTANLGAAAGETQEKLLINAALAGHTTIVFRTDIATTLKDAELSLRKALANKFTTMITGSTKYSTTTIRPAYVGFVTPDGAVLLEGVPGWKPVDSYGYSDGLLPNEVGSYRGIRVCETTLLDQSANGKEQIIILGEEALAEVGVRGMKNIESIHHGLGSAGSEDPLNRKGSFGSKFRLGACSLRPDWIAVAALEA